MSRKLKEFEVFGMKFRTLQAGAVAAFAEVNRTGPLDPMAVLPLIEVLDEHEHWVALDSKQRSNEYIRERTGFVPAHVVLESVLAAWSEVNVGFLRDWKPIKVPSYLRSEREPRQARGIDPILASIINSKQATLRDLEEFYSGEDAINLFDVSMAAKLDEADAQYQAHKESKAKARSR
ncbi:hypothetical protein WJ542_04060 [Paraburkholderia sp. B3]|uniref:hypothetical protein n=1 Tax=Paraburkholderia sp. B3 TaxID=3134791 RepID=UPI003981E7D3